MQKLKNLQDLIDHFKTMDNSPQARMGFDMNRELRHSSVSSHPCGTACCIGGWVQFLNNLDPKQFTLQSAVQTIAPEIPMAELRELCWPDNYDHYTATLEQAIRCLEILQETQKTDWARAFEEVPADA